MTTTTSSGSSGARLPAYRPPRAARTRERLRALGAIAVLLAVMAGVPVALVLLVGSPLPSSMPTRDTLTGSISASALVSVLSIVVWLAWLHFVVCLVVEWRAERRGTGVAGQVPLGSGTQALARRLIAAALLLSGTALLVVPAAPGPAQRPAVTNTAPAAAAVGVAADGTVALTSSASPAGAGAGVIANPAAATEAALVTRPDRAPKYYEVQPPEGRHYDTLWGIAERFMGDGMRYREVFDLNRGHVQPDGRTLDKPDLIRPGWTLLLPADAQGPGLRTLQMPGSPVPVPAQTPGGGASAGGAGDGSTAHGTTGQGGAVVSATHAALGPGSSSAVRDGTARGADHGGVPYRGVAGASLLAAGVLVALARRRSRGGDASAGGEVEVALRLAADDTAALFMDVALRHLSAGMAAADRPLPAIYAASLSDIELSLFLAPPDTTPPPSPWFTADNGASWRITREPGTPSGLPPDVQVPDGTPAPYPGLSTIGTDDAGARILVDVEGAPGIISLGGDPGTARDVAVSLAVELATNLWSDELRVCMVGFSDDLTPIAPHRLRYSSTLSATLTELEERVTHRRMSGVSGLGSVLRGRQAGRVRSLVSPDLLVLSAPPSHEEVERLVALAAGRDQAVGAVVVGDTPAANWRFVVRADGRLSTGVLGLDVAAQTLPVSEYPAIVAMFQTADAAPGSSQDVVVELPRTTGPRPANPSRDLGGPDGERPGRGFVTGPGTAWKPRSANRAPAAPGSAAAVGDLGAAALSRLRTVTAQGRPAAPSVPPPSVPPPSVPPPSVPPPSEAPLAPRQAPVGPVPARPAPVIPDLSRPAAVEVRVLGTVSVDAPGPVDRDRLDLLTEIVVHLALHPEGVHPGVLVAAIWPRGVSQDVVETTFGHLRAWLGVGPDGTPRIVLGDDGRWRLSGDVRCDWDLFQAFATRAGTPSADLAGDLTTALRLLSGPLWTDLPDRRYAWLARTEVEGVTRSAVTAVAHHLADLSLSVGDTATAVAATRTGLRAVPAAEILWRDLLRAVASRGDRAALEAVIGEMYRAVAPTGSGLTAGAETDALVQSLLPGYRRRTA